MTIPLNTQPGSTNPLTCPSEDSYYRWQGKSTSAQYYVNNMGVSVQGRCWWNKPGSNNGNYAPVNLGVGYSAGQAWLSIIPNKPTNPDAQLNFEIELQGEQMSGKCKYSKGQYCSGDNYENCGGDGCTVCISFSFYSTPHKTSCWRRSADVHFLHAQVSVSGGTASYVFSQ